MSDAELPVSRTKEISLSVYGIDAVLKSAHRFSGRAYFVVGQPNGTNVSVTIRAKRAGDDVDQISGEFMNELIDQRLRSLVAAETSQLRDLIMAHALSETDLTDRAIGADANENTGTRGAT